VVTKIKSFWLRLFVIIFFSPLTTYNLEASLECNVKDYGAKGDGISDDTQAIKSAINACDILHFPSGTYMVSSTIVIPSNKTLIGAKGSILKAVNDNAISDAIIKNQNWLKGNDAWITIDGLEIDGNNGKQDKHIGNDYKGIWFKNVSNFKIQQCIVHNCYGQTGSGVFVQNASNGDISHNSVYDNGGDGIQVYYGSSFIIIANNLVVNNKQIGIESEGRNGINYIDYRNTNMNIIGNICKSNIDHNILIGWTDNSNIANNVCTGSLHNGIELLGSKSISVTSNVVHSNGDNNNWADINVTAESFNENGRNKYITLTGNQLGNSLYNSIKVDTSYNIVITNNNSLSQSNGIIIGSSSAGIMIESNYIASKYAGIKIESSIDKITIIGNQIETNISNGNGIFFALANIIIDHIEISNNSFVNNYYGIYSFNNAELKNGQITNNKFINSKAKDLAGTSEGYVTLSSLFVDGNIFEKGIQYWHIGKQPITGTWRQGDKMYNLYPAAGEPLGWVCVSGGTPGEWKSMP